MIRIDLQRFSSRTLLALVSASALLPFALLEIFPAQFYRVMDTEAYLTFHNIVEFFSVLVAFSIFGIGWYTHDQSKNSQTLFLSAAFLATGLMDSMHMLSYSGMPAFFTPNSPNKSTQFWIAVRLVSAAAFVVSAYVYPDSRGKWLSKRTLASAVIVVSGSVFAGIIFFPSCVPVAFVPGAGLTPIKTASEFTVIALLSFAAFAYVKRLTRTGDKVLLYYAAAFILCVFSELYFAVYKSVFDTFNVLGHIYKVIGFSMIYRGSFVTSVKYPYLQLIASGERLRSEIKDGKRAVEALRQSEEKYRKLFDLETDALFLIDNETGGILEVNSAATALYGYSKEELLRGFITDLSAEPDKTRAAMAEKTAQIDFRWHRKKDGTVFPVDIAATHLAWRERSVHIAVIRDITNRVKADDVMREYSLNLEKKVAARTRDLEKANREIRIKHAETEAANRSKSDFLANMSHELRTPLNAVIGFSEVLQDEMFGKLNAKQHEYVRNILGGGKHLLELINDILDLSKVESGKMVLDPGKVSIRSALNASLVMVREKAAKQEVGLACELAQDVDIEVEADERKLRQILFNLLSNAVKFTPPHGSVRVSARRIMSRGKDSSESGVRSSEQKQERLNSGLDGDFIEISVEDTGIGIAPGDLSKLFNEFTQLESAYTKNHEGTGLGLALTKRLVELHNGRITVESEPGKGSRFTVVLPVKQGLVTGPAATMTRQTEKKAAAGQRALIIDDDPGTLNSMTEALTIEGYSVFTPGEGQTGVMTAQQETPDLIVLDLMMPGMSGFKAVDALRADARTASIPIIILTAMELSSAVKKRLEGRVQGIIEKGNIRKDEFAVMVGNAVNGQQRQEGHHGLENTDRRRQ